MTTEAVTSARRSILIIAASAVLGELEQRVQMGRTTRRGNRSQT